MRSPWHVGRMVTRCRAETVARRLYADEVFEEPGCGPDCRDCAYQRREWMRRRASVRIAMMRAFRP
jgi:hypothetical protein